MFNWKKIILTIIIISLLSNVVYAGNTSTHTYIIDNNNEYTNVEVVYADADGHWNIPFSDGSNGYCLEYMEEEALKGDLFYVLNTSFAVNNQTGGDVGNLLKVYFIDYEAYKDTDPIRVQHTIWHFTDDFDGWRVNKTLVDNVKETSEYKKLPDSAIIRYNSTHNLGYSFNVFKSPFVEHQDYWGYDVWFELVNSCSNDIVNNTTNVLNNYTNITKNNFYLNNTTNNYYNISNDTIIKNNYTNIYLNNTTNVQVINNTILNNYTNVSESIVNNYTNINQNTYINNTTNNINNIYINQTNTTINENNTYKNTTHNNYTFIVNNQSTNILPVMKYYIIYIIKQNTPSHNIIIENNYIQQQYPIQLTEYQTGYDTIGIGILLIILFGGMLYTILQEHK